CSALALNRPPCPRQRPRESRNSQPASSAACATATVSGHDSLLGAASDITIPPLMLRQNIPSFILFAPYIAEVGSTAALPLGFSGSRPITFLLTAVSTPLRRTAALAVYARAGTTSTVFWYSLR